VTSDFVAHHTLFHNRMLSPVGHNAQYSVSLAGYIVLD